MRKPRPADATHPAAGRNPPTGNTKAVKTAGKKKPAKKAVGRNPPTGKSNH